MTHRATLLGRGYDDDLDPPRVRFRRALLLALLSAVLPGSAQVAKGVRWIGWLALTAWFAIFAGLAALLWHFRDDRAGLFSVVTDPQKLLWLRIGLAVLALVWFGLFVDAIRLARPTSLPRWRRAFVLLTATVTSVAIVGGTAYASQLVSVQRDVVKQVFVEKKVKPPLEGRYNILLIGSDSGKDRMGLRPDSLTVVSIDASTGRTVLVSLPRNLQNVPFPDDSPMRRIYPNGYNCGSECLINAVHTQAANRKDLYPKSKDPGLDATIDAVRGATGLDINYYTMINLKGFRDLVDAVGGVEMDVKTRIAMFGHDDAWKQKYIEPGKQRLDGQQALWYARSRVQSDDYTRMGRQKCLMSAMLSQLSPQKVLLRAQQIATSSKALFTTSIPAKELGPFADLALKARGQKITTVSLVPPVVDTVNPDYAQIHRMVKKAIDASEALDEKPSSSPSASASSPSPSPSPKPSSTANESQSSANNAEDLTTAC
ncbi:MAG: LCP family protein [Aeromicrobium erythreum]